MLDALEAYVRQRGEGPALISFDGQSYILEACHLVGRHRFEDTSDLILGLKLRQYPPVAVVN